MVRILVLTKNVLAEDGRTRFEFSQSFSDYHHR